MSLLRPDVIKQQKPNQTLAIGHFENKVVLFLLFVESVAPSLLTALGAPGTLQTTHGLIISCVEAIIAQQRVKHYMLVGKHWPLCIVIRIWYYTLLHSLRVLGRGKKKYHRMRLAFFHITVVLLQLYLGVE